MMFSSEKSSIIVIHICEDVSHDVELPNHAYTHTSPIINGLVEYNSTSLNMRAFPILFWR
jgi:uncharacterized protein (UPF0147 family)